MYLWLGNPFTQYQYSVSLPKNISGHQASFNLQVSHPSASAEPEVTSAHQPRQGTSLLQPVLDEATKARQKSIQLKGMQFADELATQLLQHGTHMENLYAELKNNLSSDPYDDDQVSLTMGRIQLSQKWYEKAEAGTFTIKRFLGKAFCRSFFHVLKTANIFKRGVLMGPNNSY